LHAKLPAMFVGPAVSTVTVHSPAVDVNEAEVFPIATSDRMSVGEVGRVPTNDVPPSPTVSGSDPPPVHTSAMPPGGGE
jgi:hypothetical protein